MNIESIKAFRGLIRTILVEAKKPLDHIVSVAVIDSEEFKLAEDAITTLDEMSHLVFGTSLEELSCPDLSGEIIRED